MTGQEQPLSGVRGISDQLVDQLVVRPGGRGRRLPLVAVLGCRGSGKTALLRAIRDRCANRVPWALLDFEELVDARPSKILIELAFDLNREVPQFGRIAFPRLWLCALVLGGNLGGGSRPSALAELNRILRADRPLERHREQVLDLARLAGEAGGLPGWAPAATTTLLNGLNWVSRRRILRLVRSLSLVTTDDARDLLVDLNRKDRGSSADRVEVDAIVFEAFLADLHQAFTGRLSGMNRTANGVVLLDNTHTREGRAFLAALADARERFPGDGDHVVVCTTSRVWNPAWTATWRRPCTEVAVDRGAPRTAEEAVGDDVAGRDWGGWYLVGLGRLDAVAADRFVAGEAVLPKGFAHRLTRGHPGALRAVLDAVADRDTPPTPRDLRGLLAAPSEQESGKPLADKALDYLCQDLSKGQARDLVTASAGRGIEFLTEPAVLRTDRGGGGELYAFLANNFLLTTDHGEVVLEPWLRVLLLHALARRPEDDPLGWTAVHRRCQEYHETRGRAAAARYHELARGGVASAVAHLVPPFTDLTRSLDVTTARTWLRDLDLITSAPNRLPKDVDPLVQVEDLVEGVPTGERPLLALPRLVVALWLGHDPLGDPGGVLRGRIAHAYEHLADQCGPGSILLYERAEGYRE
jgi:hypothetical protein